MTVQGNDDRSSEVPARLEAVFRKVFKDPKLVLRPELTSWDVEGWDSLANMQLMLSAEAEFGVRLAAGEILRLKSAGDLIDLIETKLEARPNRSENG